MFLFFIYYAIFYIIFTIIQHSYLIELLHVVDIAGAVQRDSFDHDPLEYD